MSQRQSTEQALQAHASCLLMMDICHSPLSSPTVPGLHCVDAASTRVLYLKAQATPVTSLMTVTCLTCRWAEMCMLWNPFLQLAMMEVKLHQWHSLHSRDITGHLVSNSVI